ncbi:cobaltochelatase subunit CobN, partial [Myxococcota bacterium]
VIEGRRHVLGQVPDAQATDCYWAEARGAESPAIPKESLQAALQRTSDEMEHVLHALGGRFISPGPSGHLSRGKTEVLPTGRNFFGTDLNAVPTRAAWDMGVRMGTLLLERYWEEEGQFPSTIGITLWSSDVFQAEGELVSQVLWLLGCRPVWTGAGRVRGVELIPLEELALSRADGGDVRARPRIDVVVQMSGVVRDTLPNMYVLIDEAASLAGEQDESPLHNFVRAHMQARLDSLRQEMAGAEESALRCLASARVFSSQPGSYGTGVQYAVDASAWETDQDLAEVFINWTGYAYGTDGARKSTAVPARAALKEYAHLMGTVDVAYQKALGAEYDALSISCCASSQGGMAVTRRTVSGRDAKLYWGDSVSTVQPELRDLREELELSVTGRLLNDAWLEQRKADGYQGAGTVACRVGTLFVWSALTRQVTKAHFDAVHRTLIENDDNRRWLSEANIYALEEITRRLLEASSRGLWQADERRLEQLKEIVLQIEGDMEEGIGLVQGEMQGGSVDIKTRRSVETWKYEFTL